MLSYSESASVGRIWPQPKQQPEKPGTGDPGAPQGESISCPLHPRDPWVTKNVMIYLDHAAATPVDPIVAEAMARVQADAFGNPSSQHAAGRRARRCLEEAREKILALLGARPGDHLIFTSGATEANHLAVHGTVLGAAAWHVDRQVSPPVVHVATSQRDHPSLQAAAASLVRNGRGKHVSLPLNATGLLDRNALSAWVASGQNALDDAGAGLPCGWQILCTTLVCGQTGTIETLHDFASHPGVATDRDGGQSGLSIHTDATQAIAFTRVDGRELFSHGLTSLTLAPHKFGGPRGIGGLLISPGLPLAAVFAGTQEMEFRGGTESVLLAVGFAAALERISHLREAETTRITHLRDRLEKGLLAAARAVGISAHVVASEAARSPHITAISFPGIDRQALAMASDLAGISLATGTACASGSLEPSPALVAMGLPPLIFQSAVRLSLGSTTTEADIETAVSVIEHLLGRLASGAGRQVSLPAEKAVPAPSDPVQSLRAARTPGFS